MKIGNQYVIPGSFTKTWEKTPDGFLRARVRVLREGIMPYGRAELDAVPDEVTEDPIMMMVSMDSMASAESLRSLEGAGLVVGKTHKWLTPETAKESDGHVAGSPKIDGPFVEVDVLATDPTAIQRIESGEFPDISAAYHAESLWEPGEFDGSKYHAKQIRIFYNHILACPPGMARGEDLKILNQKKEGQAMPDLIKVKLPLTGRFINTDEDGAKAIDEEERKGKEHEEKLKNEGDEKGKSLESTMSELDGKNKEAAGLQKEIDELKGGLAVYKKKLDELLSEEAVEKKAGEMNEEQDEADEIIENCEIKNEKGEEPDEKAKDEFKNTYRKLHGQKLHEYILKAVGMKIENMSPDALRGAFKANHSFIMNLKAKNKTVAGANLTRGMFKNETGGGASERKGTVHSRLGFPVEKK